MRKNHKSRRKNSVCVRARAMTKRKSDLDPKCVAIARGICSPVGDGGESSVEDATAGGVRAERRRAAAAPSAEPRRRHVHQVSCSHGQYVNEPSNAPTLGQRPSVKMYVVAG